MMRTGHGHKNIRGFSPLSPPLAPPLITSNNRTPQSLKLTQLKNKSPGETIFTHKLLAHFTKSCYNGYKELTFIECVIFLIHS